MQLSEILVTVSADTWMSRSSLFAFPLHTLSLFHFMHSQDRLLFSVPLFPFWHILGFLLCLWPPISILTFPSKTKRSLERCYDTQGVTSLCVVHYSICSASFFFFTCMIFLYLEWSSFFPRRPWRRGGRSVHCTNRLLPLFPFSEDFLLLLLMCCFFWCSLRGYSCIRCYGRFWKGPALSWLWCLCRAQGQKRQSCWLIDMQAELPSLRC